MPNPKKELIGRLWNQFGDDWQKVWHGSDAKLKGAIDHTKYDDDTPLGPVGNYLTPTRGIAEGYRGSKFRTDSPGSLIRAEIPGHSNFINYTDDLRYMDPMDQDIFKSFLDDYNKWLPEGSRKTSWDDYLEEGTIEDFISEIGDPWGYKGYGKGSPGYVSGEMSGPLPPGMKDTGEAYEYIVKDSRNIRELGRNVVPLAAGAGMLASNEAEASVPNRLEPMTDQDIRSMRELYPVSNGDIRSMQMERMAPVSENDIRLLREPGRPSTPSMLNFHPVSDKDIRTLRRTGASSTETGPRGQIGALEDREREQRDKEGLAMVDRIRREPPGIYGPKHPGLLGGIDAVRSIPGADFFAGGILDVGAEYAWGRESSTMMKAMAGLELGGGAIGGKLLSMAGKYGAKALGLGRMADDAPVPSQVGRIPEPDVDYIDDITDLDYPDLPESMMESLGQQFPSKVMSYPGITKPRGPRTLEDAMQMSRQNPRENQSWIEYLSSRGIGKE